MAVEALTVGKEVSGWIKEGRIPEDFSGRPTGYQTWVDLLQEIDSNPVDAERLKAMKAMFLAANEISLGDDASILACQLFQIAKSLNSSQLLLLRSLYKEYQEYTHRPRTGGMYIHVAMARDGRAQIRAQIECTYRTGRTQTRGVRFNCSVDA